MVTCDGDLARPLARPLEYDQLGLLETVNVSVRVDWKCRAEKNNIDKNS